MTDSLARRSTCWRVERPRDATSVTGNTRLSSSPGAQAGSARHITERRWWSPPAAVRTSTDERRHKTERPMSFVISWTTWLLAGQWSVVSDLVVSDDLGRHSGFGGNGLFNNSSSI